MFVHGSTATSNAAIQHFRFFCAERLLPGSWVLEIVDLDDSPEAAKQHGILVTPAVIMRAGNVVRKIVGDFHNEQRVVDELKLTQI